MYTKDKLKRFGLIDDNICPRCDEVEDLDHKVRSCEYVKRIWLATSRLLNETQNLNSVAMILGTELDQTLTKLTIKAEVLSRIMYLRDAQTYLIRDRGYLDVAIAKKIVSETCEKQLQKYLVSESRGAPF